MAKKIATSEWIEMMGWTSTSEKINQLQVEKQEKAKKKCLCNSTIQSAKNNKKRN